MNIKKVLLKGFLTITFPLAYLGNLIINILLYSISDTYRETLKLAREIENDWFMNDKEVAQNDF